MMRSTRASLSPLIPGVLLLLAISASPVQSALSYGNCTAGSMYYCPSLCGGTNVTDCFKDCDGFLSTDEEHKICIERRLFQKRNVDPKDYKDHYHFLWKDLVGAVVWFVAAGISIACGVGGGGIYVPLGILLFGFAPKPASGLSQASMFGTGLAGLILSAKLRLSTNAIRSEPELEEEEEEEDALPRNQNVRCEQENKKFYTRPHINFDMVLFMAPMQMAGAVLGVIVQIIMPNWQYLLFAVVFLSYTAYGTYLKYFSARAAENAKQQGEAKSDEGESESKDESESKADSDSLEVESVMERTMQEVTLEEGTVDNTGLDTTNLTETDLVLRAEYLEDDMRQYPKEKIGALIFLWIGLFLLTLIKGGKGLDSLVGIDCLSSFYPVVIACEFAWLFAFALFFGRKLVKGQEARKKVSYPLLEDDPNFDAKTMLNFGVMSFVSGVIAALTGVGGGMVLGPVMLVAGINPKVVVATNASMIVITTSSISLMFVTSGQLHFSYAIFYFCVCFCGAWFGKVKIDSYISRTGRVSILIFLLASIIAFATIGCLYTMVMSLNEAEWCFEAFHDFCTVGDGEDSCPADRFLSALQTF